MMRDPLIDEAFDLYNRLVKYAMTTPDRDRACDATTLAHDAIVRYLRRAGHSEYVGRYHASDNRIRFRPRANAANMVGTDQQDAA